jgi:hypothetical protein
MIEPRLPATVQVNRGSLVRATIYDNWRTGLFLAQDVGQAGFSNRQDCDWSGRANRIGVA